VDGSSIVTASGDKSTKLWDSVPFRAEDLPGDGKMTWEERFNLWRLHRYQEWLLAHAAR
jgi:hypothetical protein